MPTRPIDAYLQGKEAKRLRPDLTNWEGVLPYSVQHLVYPWLDGWNGISISWSKPGDRCPECYWGTLTDKPDGFIRCLSYPCRTTRWRKTDWLAAGNNVDKLLRELPDRKKQLFVLACCRDWSKDPRIDRYELCIGKKEPLNNPTFQIIREIYYCAKLTIDQMKQVAFLKDLYNPSLDWSLKFSSDIINLAEEVYKTQKEDSRLVLSDMLEDGDYPDEIIWHLKSGIHIKGCWLIDQILGN